MMAMTGRRTRSGTRRSFPCAAIALAGVLAVHGGVSPGEAAGPARVTLEKSGASALSSEVLKRMVEQRGGAVFDGLDKVTARVTTIYAPIDIPVRFGSLQITTRTCNKRPPEEPPEQTVFVEVDDMQAGPEPHRLFTGWMFWSSPGRNALEHPVYDIWLTDCMANAPPASTGSE